MSLTEALQIIAVAVQIATTCATIGITGEILRQTVPPTPTPSVPCELLDDVIVLAAPGVRSAEF